MMHRIRSVVGNRRWLSAFAPWLAFGIAMAWSWRVGNLFTHLPAYGDILEVTWGMQWYYRRLIIEHASPAVYPLVFYPHGWHVFTMAYTPALFVLSLPLYALGGPAFAYNLLILVSVVLCFAGCLRLGRMLSDPFAVTVGALVYTFANFHWLRIGGQVNMMLLTGVLPWFVWLLWRLRAAPDRRQQWRLALWAGLTWGGMILVALYGVFLGALCFAVWGRHLWTKRGVAQAVAIALLAVTISSPVLVLYQRATRADDTIIFSLDNVQIWGASADSVFIPSISHPVPALRSLAQHMYRSPDNESSIANLGIVGGLLGVAGGVVAWRQRRRGLVAFALIGVVCMLGVSFKWDGFVVRQPWFAPVNAALWRVGHWFKPQLFAAVPPESFRDAVPLPSLLLTMVVPFWEGARVMARYVLVGGLGMSLLGMLALPRRWRPVRYAVALLWLVEAMPTPTGSVPLPTALHPAYQWVAQHIQPGQAIIDVGGVSLRVGGEIVLAADTLNVPTASFVSSSWPGASYPLWAQVAQKETFAEWGIANRLSTSEVRFLLLHIDKPEDKERQKQLVVNPSFKFHDCFDPLPGASPWEYDICVFEPQPIINVAQGAGWSIQEAWGMWSQGLQSVATWESDTVQVQELVVDASPLCGLPQPQTITVTVNDTVIDTHTWAACEAWQAVLPIDAALVRQGTNTLVFDYGSATAPRDVLPDATDGRLLSLSFRKLLVRPVASLP